MARFVGSVGWPPGTLSADCTFSTIELHPVCMYTTRAHILYARVMIEREKEHLASVPGYP